MGVTVGIDSHKSSLAVAVLDELGRPLGVWEFANNPKEHENLRRWVASHGAPRLIGVEGSGNFGAALTRHLLENGEDVHEVPAFLSHRERKKPPRAASQILKMRWPSPVSQLAGTVSRRRSGRRCFRT